MIRSSQGLMIPSCPKIMTGSSGKRAIKGMISEISAKYARVKASPVYPTPAATDARRPVFAGSASSRDRLSDFITSIRSAVVRMKEAKNSPPSSSIPRAFSTARTRSSSSRRW